MSLAARQRAGKRPMSLRKWAFIFLSPGFTPDQHSVRLRSGECEVILIGMGMDEKEKVVEAAKDLVSKGVQLIELCGGFGPIWIAAVSYAIQNAVPVGSVAYGPEARGPLLEILKTKEDKEKES